MAARITTVTSAGEAVPGDRDLDSASFREAMGRFATGVTVATSRLNDADVAMTVNAFASVSLDPLLVVLCAYTRSRWACAVGISGGFAVSVLSSAQVQVATSCARQGRCDDTELLEWFGVSRCPNTAYALIDGAIAGLICRVDQTFPAGDHLVIIGRVDQILLGEDAPPLVFLRGGYTTTMRPHLPREGVR